MQRNIIPLKKAGAGNLTPSVSIAPVIKKMDIKTEGTDSESDMSDSEKKIRKVAGKPKGKCLGLISCNFPLFISSFITEFIY